MSGELWTLGSREYLIRGLPVVGDSSVFLRLSVAAAREKHLVRGYLGNQKGRTIRVRDAVGTRFLVVCGARCCGFQNSRYP